MIITTNPYRVRRQLPSDDSLNCDDRRRSNADDSSGSGDMPRSWSVGRADPPWRHSSMACRHEPARERRRVAAMVGHPVDCSFGIRSRRPFRFGRVLSCIDDFGTKFSPVAR